MPFDEEFEALGVEFAHRGTALSQSIEALKVCFADEHPTLAAPFASAELGLQPRPVQLPRPPIFVAGSTEAAMRRAARYADGWLPQSPASAEMIEFVTTERARHAPDDPLSIGHIGGMVYVGTPSHELSPYAMTGSPSSIAERLHSSIPAGVHLVQIMFTARSAQEMADQVAAFGAGVIPHFN